MGKLTIIGAFLFASLTAFAQQQYTFSDAKSIYSTSTSPNVSDEEDLGNDIAVNDSLVAIVGNFSGTSIRIDGVGLSSAETDNAALLLFDKEGNYLFQKSHKFTGSGQVTADQVLFDGNGNVLVAGTFTGSSISADLQTLSQSGNKASFLVAFDTNGDFLWSNVLESSDTVHLSSMSVDSQGNIIIGGQFSGTGFTVGPNTISSNGDYDAFVASLDASGNGNWVYGFGRTAQDGVNDVYVTPEDSILVGASFSSDSIFIENDTIINATTGGTGFNALALTLDGTGAPQSWTPFASPLNVFSSEIVGSGNTWFLAVKHRGMLYGNNPSNVHFDIQVIKFVNNAYASTQLIRSASYDDEVTDLVWLDNGNILITGTTKGLGLQFDLVSYPSVSDITGQKEFFVFEMTQNTGFVRGLRKGDEFGDGDDILSAVAPYSLEELWTVGSFYDNVLPLDLDTLVEFDSDNFANLWFSKMNLNNLPQGITFSNSSVPENGESGTFITTLDISDVDPTDTHTISLDPSKADNLFFDLLSGDSLVTNAVFDFEADASYALKFDVTDSRGGSRELDLSISITNVNEKPTNIFLSSKTVSENENTGTAVGTLTTEDEDTHSNGFLYSLVEGTGDTDNGKFAIEDDQLVLADALDFETQSSAAIRVRTDDQEGFTFDTTFTIEIKDYILSSSLDTASTGLSSFGGTDFYAELAIDGSGNRYVIGNVSGETQIDNQRVNAGDVLVKYSPALDVLWARNTSNANDIVIDSDTVFVLSANRYIYKYAASTGQLIDSVSTGFNSYQLMAMHNDTLIVAKDNGVWFAAYDRSGELLYEQHELGSGIVTNGLIVNNEGIFLSFQSSTNFTVDNQSINRRQGFLNAFVLAFNKDGSYAWHDVVGVSGSSSLNTYNRDLLEGVDGSLYSVCFNNRQSTGATYTLTTNGGSVTTTQNGFVVRYQPDGSQVSLITYPNEIDEAAIDPNGNLYFEDVGSSSITKYNSSGTLLWTDSEEVSYNDLVFKNGELVGVGGVSGVLSFNASTFDATNNNEAVILNFSDLGAQQEFDVVGNPTGGFSLYGLGSPYNNTLRAVGAISGQLIIGEDTLRATDTFDPLIIEYSIGSDLSINSIKNISLSSAASTEEPDAIITDANGNSLIWDRASSALSGGNFLMKMNSAGDTVWTRIYNNARISDAVFGESGDIFVCVVYAQSTVDLGGGNSFTHSGSGDNILVFKLDANGDLLWAQNSTADNSYTYNHRLALDGDSVYVAGHFESSLTVNSTTISVESLGVDEVFLYKLDNLGNTLMAKKYNKGSGVNYQFRRNVFVKNGQVYLHNRNYETAQDEIIRTDRAGFVDMVYTTPASSVSEIPFENNQFYLLSSSGEQTVIDLDFNVIEEYSSPNNFYGSVQVRNDTLFNLKNNLVSRSIIRQGLEGFTLDTDTVPENYTGFLTKLVPENASDQGTFTENNFRTTISNDSLFIVSAENYESSDSVFTVSIDFSNGFSTITRDFEIRVQDVNEAPTSIDFTPFTISESDTIGTAVGVMSGTDPDLGDSTLTFEPADSLSNVRFYADGDTLRLASLLDFEAFNNSGTSVGVAINLKATDNDGLTFDRFICSTCTDRIVLSNVNELPLSLDTITRTEAVQPSGSQLNAGQIRANDPDFYSFYTSNNYFLVDSLADNALFSMSSSSLIFDNDSTANYERDSVFQLTVGVYDSGYPDTVYLPLVVKLTNGNDPITNINLSADSIPENMPAGSLVGRISWEDEDVDAGYRLFLSSNSARFALSGDSLITTRSLDHESSATQNLQIGFDDTVSTLNTLFQSYTIEVLDRNDLPEFGPVVNYQNTSSNNFDENDTSSLHYLKVLKIDQDNDKVLLSLTEGEGDSLNHLFKVDTSSIGSNDAGWLRPSQPFDYEEFQLVTARLRLTDEQGGVVDSVFTFNIEDQNDSLTNIRLTNYRINEWTGTAETLGDVLFDDEDDPTRSFYSYSIENPGGVSTGGLTITDATGVGALISNSLLNFENLDSATVPLRIVVRDELRRPTGASLGQFDVYSDTFSIEVVNINEPPTNLRLDRGLQTQREDVPVGTLLALVRVDDPEGIETVTFESDFDGLEIRGDSLVIARPLDYETDGNQVFFDIIATDTGGLSISNNYSLQINNVSEFDMRISWQDTIFDENLSEGTEVANLTFFIDDNPSTSDFSLVEGEGDDHNSAFSILPISSFDSRLVVASDTSLNYEEIGDTIRVRIAATRVSDLEISSFALLNDVNDPITSVNYVGDTAIEENVPARQEMGTIVVEDEDASDRFLFTIEPEGLFAVSGNTLLTNAVFDYETYTGGTILITATDKGGATAETSFVFVVLNDVTSPGEEVTSVDKSESLIYPNPASTVLYLDQYQQIFTSFVITELSGKVIQEGEVANQEISLENVNPGMYHLRLTHPEGEESLMLSVIRR